MSKKILSSNDKVILDKYIMENATSYMDCFTDELSMRYLDRFTTNRYQSALYNEEFIKIHLEALKDVSSTYEGIEDEKLNKELKTYFCVKFKECVKELLPNRIKEIKKNRKENKVEKDTKGKKSKKEIDE